jgi:hypothetical protein
MQPFLVKNLFLLIIKNLKSKEIYLKMKKMFSIFSPLFPQLAVPPQLSLKIHRFNYSAHQSYRLC